MGDKSRSVLSVTPKPVPVGKLKSATAKKLKPTPVAKPLNAKKLTPEQVADAVVNVSDMNKLLDGNDLKGVAFASINKGNAGLQNVPDVKSVGSISPNELPTPEPEAGVVYIDGKLQRKIDELKSAAIKANGIKEQTQEKSQQLQLVGEGFKAALSLPIPDGAKIMSIDVGEKKTRITFSEPVSSARTIGEISVKYLDITI